MTATNKLPKGKKLILFKVLAFLFPLLLLVLLELALRLFNYGHNTDLFVKYPKDDRFWQINYYASDKFFSDTVNATKGSSEIFSVNKSPNTFRIFVLGESTTIGYPYFHNGAFHRWLQFRLMQMYPDRNFEIVNLSMTALNSYAVLDFGRQLAQYQPDAIMIYAGHNEYYGAMGIGSTSSVGSNHFMVEALVKLRQLRLVQLLNNIISKMRPSSSPKVDTRENLMKRMAAKQEIPYGSKDYQAGLDQFNRNISELCSLFNDQHIPVFLGTVVSNEKDQPPFISKGNGPVSAAYNYKAGEQAFADLNFGTAKTYFDKAKDLDQLRFRAPEAINSIIEKIAGKYPAVHLVDVKGLFEQCSPHSIVGKETIWEHVHPNLYGYAIMSEAFFQAFEKQQLIKDKPQKVLSFAELRKEMPLTRMDSLTGEYQIRMLKRGWPFNQPLPASFGPGPRLDDSLAYELTLGHMEWKEAMEQLYTHAEKTGNKAAQLTIVEAMTLEYPNDEQFCGLAASLNSLLHHYDMAALYYKKLNQITPDARLAARVIKLYLKAGQLDNAVTAVKDLPAEQQPVVNDILARINSTRQMLKSQPGNRQAATNLVAYYHKLGIADSLITNSMK